MKRNILYAGLVLTLLCLNVKALETLSYKVIQNDPSDFKNLWINIYPANVDIASPVTLRYGAGIEYKMNKILSFSLDLEKGYLNLAGAQSKAVTKTGLYAEAGGVFNFASSEKEVTQGVPLKSVGGYGYGSGGTTINYYLNVPNVKVHKDFGLRGGLYFFSSPKDLADKKTIAGTLNGVNVIYNMTGIYAGIGTTSYRKIVIEPEGYSTKRWEGRYNLYFDVMFAPLILYSYNDAAGSKDAILDQVVETKHLGWRAGYMMQFKSAFRILYGIEFGSRSGINGGGFFFLKFAIPFGINFQLSSLSK